MTRVPLPIAPVAVRGRFVLRLAATLVLTTSAVGVAQYELAGRALTERVLTQDLDGHRADGEVLTSLYRPDDADPMAEVASLLGHMAARPGLTGVALLDVSGDVVLQGTPHRLGYADMPADMPGDMPGDMPTAEMPGHDGRGERAVSPGQRRLAANVVTDGRAASEHERASRMVVHAVPLQLGDVPHVLVVTRSDAPLEAQVASVRRVLLSTLALGAVIALPLFFLIGGRVLAARHRLAVQTSMQDALTGLGNHGSFHERLAEVVAHDRGPRSPLCLALVDLDGFKQVNDGQGHRRGDEVLAQVAAVLREVVPDGAYRVGGDEFALLLRVDLAQAGELAEQVRARVADLRLGVTSSIGVAPYVHDGGVQALWDAADAALYAAKHGGRDRVVVDGSQAALAGA